MYVHEGERLCLWCAVCLRVVLYCDTPRGCVVRRVFLRKRFGVVYVLSSSMFHRERESKVIGV